MICFPNCKINLGLSVTKKGPDGYHLLETVFLPLDLHDVLEFLPAQETTFNIAGQKIPGPQEDNLVLKAYRILKQDFPSLPPIKIALLKQIPTGAGLGGGSADASFMLTALNTTFQLGLSPSQLEAYALRLGSDCPFFIRNTPQYAEGRGEQMKPMAVDLSSYLILLINPGLHISTSWAFAQLTPCPSRYPIQDLVSTMDLNEWKHKLINDFEEPVFHRHPKLREIKATLYQHGALYASMSGSGSTLFGIFDRTSFQQQKKAEKFRELFGSMLIIETKQCMKTGY